MTIDRGLYFTFYPLPPPPLPVGDKMTSQTWREKYDHVGGIVPVQNKSVKKKEKGEKK